MGFLLGIISAATFGLIPLFSLPVMRAGISVETVLFHRFSFAFFFLGIVLVLRHERFHLPSKDLLKIAGLSFMYTMSALLYFWGFSQAPSGIATTLHFIYPLMVMLLMIGFFHEKFSWITLGAVLLAFSGVALLVSSGGEEHPLSITALVVLLASALANGVYITGIHAARLRHTSGLMITFYVLFFGSIYTFINAQLRGAFQWVTDPGQLGLLFLLAVVTAVISNVTLVLAVKRIGSTLTSVLGATEPLTAVVVGVLVFKEPLTSGLMGGVGLILSAVAMVMLGPQIITLGHKILRK